MRPGNFLLYSLAVIILTASCKHEGENSKKQTVKTRSELVDEFVITAYSGPPPGEINEERYNEIAAAGIDVIVPGNGSFSPEQNLAALDLAQKAGIRVLPIDQRIMAFGQTADVQIDTALIRKIVNGYKDHPAFAGYVIRDEPGMGLFPALGKVCTYFKEADPGHEPLINLFPSYASDEQLETSDFRTYIRSFIDTVHPGLLSFDFYALRESETWSEGWFNDLAIVREETRIAGIPFWVFIQSEGIRDYLRIPNRSEILWQVNTAVAYGARGLGWFTYWTPQADQSIPQVEGAPPPLVEEHYGGMLDIEGNPTPLFNFVTEANNYIHYAGRALLGWDNSHVARYEQGKLIEGSSPLIKPFSEDANLVIGTFSLGERRRIVISNSSHDIDFFFTLVIPPEWQVNSVITFIDAIPPDLEDPELTTMIDPGGSVVLDLGPNTK